MGMLERLRRRLYLARRNIVGVSQEAWLRLQRSRDTPRISLCTAFKGRFDHLVRTALKNLDDCSSYENSRFVFLNYDCPDPRTEPWVRQVLMPRLRSGRGDYYRIYDCPSFRHGHARNLAFRLASAGIVCNVDADNYVGEGFCEYIAALVRRGGSFLGGPVDGRGLAGRIALYRDDWDAVGGYDERIESWGGEDIELAERLARAGLVRRMIWPEKFCRTIQHSDELRLQYSAHSGLHASERVGREVIAEGRREQRNCANPGGFGHGRVRKNFASWCEA